MVNAYIRLKKLQFGADKCKKMHVGKYCDEVPAHICRYLGRKQNRNNK